MPGFAFHETMSGLYHLDDQPTKERAVSFTVTARALDLVRFAQDRVAAAEGEMVLEGIADHRPTRGTLVIDPILGRRIAYDLRFMGDDGRGYRLAGEKTIRFLSPLHSMTTLPAELFDESGKKIGEGRLRFDARNDMLAFVRSFRVR